MGAEQQQKGAGGEASSVPRIVLLVCATLVVLIIFGLFDDLGATSLSLDEFVERLERNEVSRITFQDGRAELELRPGDLAGAEGPRRRRVQFIDAEHSGAYELRVAELARRRGFGIELRALEGRSKGASLFFLLSLASFAVLAWLLLRPMGGAGAGILRFGRSRHRVIERSDGAVGLADVAGVEEAKAEVAEIIEYLRAPERFARIGARIPKGVLLIGAPGTGKTLLARAAAGEAKAKFFSASGSDFVEMFAGVGASRARDMFKQARDNAPCILFLDEIDAVGRQRGGSVGGGHDERDQTLNQILVEMDGFDSSLGVIVMAATNRPDILDSALLRPGRFDRKIVLNLPDVMGREAILGVHGARAKLADNVDLKTVARATPGFSGAELEALINEAALAAALDHREQVDQADLEESRDKVRWGRQKHSRAVDGADLEATAWHEAGHALVALALEHADPIHKVTIIPRGMALGATMSLPEKDVVGLRKQQILDKIALCYGGRLGERTRTGDLSTGAANDLEQATDLARRMVMEWGMADQLGLRSYAGRPQSEWAQRSYSEDMARRLDLEVEAILQQQHRRAEAIVVEEAALLELIAAALLRYETVTGSELERLKAGCAVADLRAGSVGLEEGLA